MNTDYRYQLEPSPSPARNPPLSHNNPALFDNNPALFDNNPALLHKSLRFLCRKEIIL